MNFNHTIFLFGDNTQLSNTIELYLKDSFLVKKIFENNMPIRKDNNNIMMLTCNYSCKIKKCYNNFLLMNKYKYLPSVIVRPFLTNIKLKREIFLISPLNYNNWPKKEIMNTLNELLGFNNNSDLFIHPTNPLYKVIEVQKHIVDNLTQNESLSSLSTLFNISNSWLSNKFKEICGINLSEYSRIVKLCQSLWQLISTDEPIKSIALDLGIQPQYFSKIFKYKYKVTPAAIRKYSPFYKKNI